MDNSKESTYTCNRHREPLQCMLLTGNENSIMKTQK